jgi:hypothetical protein
LGSHNGKHKYRGKGERKRGVGGWVGGRLAGRQTGRFKVKLGKGEIVRQRDRGERQRYSEIERHGNKETERQS